MLLFCLWAEQNTAANVPPEAAVCSNVNEFLCNSSLDCIPASFVCDGEFDCDDGIDEQLCHGQFLDLGLVIII